RLGIAESTEWTKDDVLFALEDLALLMHAQSVMHSDCQDAILFDLMTFPAGSDPETDGLGWRTQEQVDESLKQYQVWVDWVLPELTRATEDLSLDDQVDSLRQILGRFNLGLPNTYGARPVIGEIVTQTFPGSVVEMVRAYKVYYQVCGITCDTDEKADRFTTAYTRVNEANDKLLMLYLCGQYFANIAQNLLNVPEDEWRESLHQIKNIEHGYRENFGLLSEPGIQSAGGIDKVVQMRDIILRLFLPEQAGQ
ncbi:MAG: hypothetical protein U9Q67_04570, partial [Patescibacteria group bacterium]|nr:hypothetical protein [Patescibacteria group bacterium]